MTPSTTWREVVQGGEEERFTAGAQRLSAIQRNREQKYRKVGRALHRQQHMGLAGELEVLGDLPEHAAHGIFAKAARHPVWVRLSNASMDDVPDSRPDIRGFAIKVREIDGEGALGARTTCQDFLLINRSAFGFARPEPFFDLVEAASKGLLAIVAMMVRTYGLFGGLKRLGELQKTQKLPFTGYASEKFFSAAPISCGPYAVRVRIVPEQSGLTVKSYAKDIEDRLVKDALRWQLQLQFFVDENETPIEDGSVDWKEADAPYLTVARLTLPSQRAHQLDETIEKATFDPWSALKEHRPLGAIMRARKVAYLPSQKARGAA